MKGILVRKSHCIMIRDEFRSLSNINDEAESCYLFWQKALSWLMGSKYGSDDECCYILREYFQ